MTARLRPTAALASSVASVPIRVAIVDDKRRFRNSLVTVLKGTRAFRTVSICKDTDQALREIPLSKPDVVVVDLQLPKMSGIGCIRRLKAQNRNLQFLAITDSEDLDEIFGAIRAGATGCVIKRGQYATILEAIEEVHAGGAPMTPRIARLVLESLRTPRSENSEPELLSRREREVLRLAERGLRYREIGETLGIDFHTVRTHFNRIYQKLKVHSRSEAVMKYSGREVLRLQRHSAEG